MNNWDIVGGWFLFNVLMCAGALSFAIFLHTKRGKKWLEDL